MFSLVQKKILSNTVSRVSPRMTLGCFQTRSVGNVKKLDEKEKGDERIYFTKEDGK